MALGAIPSPPPCGNTGRARLLHSSDSNATLVLLQYNNYLQGDPNLAVPSPVHLRLCHCLQLEVSVGGPPCRLHQVALACKHEMCGMGASSAAYVLWMVSA